MAKSLGFQVNFKNEHKASFLAKEISNWFHRGTALERRIETVLNGLREVTGIKSLKKLDQEVIRSYVDHIKERVSQGELTKKTAENYLSALNKIIEYTNARLERELETISPRAEGLSRGAFEFVNRAVSQEVHEKFKSFLSEKQDIRAQALGYSVDLQREFGLRLRESIAIKAETIERALSSGVLHLTKEDMTKNGREREIPIINSEQREALEKALDFMKEHGLSSLCPTERLREQYHYAENVAKEFKEITGENFSYHGERHFFAQEAIREGIDRGTVSEWLGHNRLEVTKVYAK